jgi:hypothetical protein
MAKHRPELRRNLVPVWLERSMAVEGARRPLRSRLWFFLAPLTFVLAFSADDYSEATLTPRQRHSCVYGR